MIRHQIGSGTVDSLLYTKVESANKFSCYRNRSVVTRGAGVTAVLSHGYLLCTVRTSGTAQYFTRRAREHLTSRGTSGPKP